MARNFKQVTENTNLEDEVFKVMYEKIFFIKNFKEQENEAEIIYDDNKIYVVLYRELEPEERKWLNFYLLVHGSINYGENDFFSLKLSENNKNIHSIVLTLLENTKFTSKKIKILLLELKGGVDNEKC